MDIIVADYHRVCTDGIYCHQNTRNDWLVSNWMDWKHCMRDREDTKSKEHIMEMLTCHKALPLTLL